MLKKRPRKRPFSMVKHVVKGSRRFGPPAWSQASDMLSCVKNHQGLWTVSPCGVIVLA